MFKKMELLKINNIKYVFNELQEISGFCFNLTYLVIEYCYKEKTKWRIAHEQIVRYIDDAEFITMAYHYSQEIQYWNKETETWYFVARDLWSKSRYIKYGITEWLKNINLSCYNANMLPYFEMYCALTSKKTKVRKMWIHDDYIQIENARWNIKHFGDLSLIP